MHADLLKSHYIYIRIKNEDNNLIVTGNMMKVLVQSNATDPQTKICHKQDTG